MKEIVTIAHMLSPIERKTGFNHVRTLLHIVMHYISSIPPEVFVQILEYLSQEDLKKNVSLTCTRWRDVVQDFGLVRINVNLYSPFNYCFGKLMHDLKRNPGFGHNIKMIEMKDYDTLCDNKNKDFHYDYGVDRFRSVLELCQNLEELQMRIGSLKFFNAIIDEIFPAKGQLNILKRLNLLKLNFCELEDADQQSEINLAKFLNHNILGLHQLFLYTETNYLNPPCLHFTTSDLYHTNTSSLTTIKIVCPNLFMEKSCLDYIISGNITNLKDLDLFLMLIVSLKDPLHNGITIQEDDTVFDKLNIFCSTALKKCNITIRNKYGSQLLSIDNCRNQNEKSNQFAVENPFDWESDYASDEGDIYYYEGHDDYDYDFDYDIDHRYYNRLHENEGEWQ